MAQQTILRVLLNQEVESVEYHYALINAEGVLEASGYDDIGALPISEEVVLVIPSSCLTLTKIKLPAGVKFQSPKFEQMLPAAVEDQILSDISQVHVVADRPDSDGNYPVAIVDKGWLRAQVDRFTRVERTVSVIVAEVLFGDVDSNCWELTVTPEETILRVDVSTVIWMDSVKKDPPVALILRLKQVGAERTPEKLLLRTNLAIDAATWEDALGIPVEKIALADQSRWMISSALPSLNLAVREFKPVRKNTGFEWGRLKLAAVLFSVAVLISVLDLGISLIRDIYKQDRLETAIQATFKEAFPEIPVTSSAVMQMEEELTKLKHRVGEQSKGDFLPMLSVVADVLAKNQIHRVISMDYQQGTLIYQIGAVAGGVDLIVDQIRLQGYQVQADVSDSGVILQVSVEQ